MACSEKRLVPQIQQYLSENPSHVVDVHIALSNSSEALPDSLKPYTVSFSAVDFKAPAMYTRTTPSTNVYSTLSMFYHNKKAWQQALDSGRQYDIWLKFRPDIVHASLPLLLEAVVNNNDRATVYVPKINQNLGVNDQVAFGFPATAHAYFGVYDHIDDNYRKDMTYILNPEFMLAYHLKKQGVTMRYVDYIYHLDPSRHKK